MRLALFQPDIPQNTGAILRLGACLGVACDIIEPAGFPVTDRHFRRSGMDYLDHVEITRHPSWRAFMEAHAARGGRLVLATTRGATPLPEFTFQAGDTILLGRESAGAPGYVHAAADARVYAPLAPGMRSLNVAMTAAIFVAEALRQTNAWPRPAPGPQALPGAPSGAHQME
ncbi:tRNA (cytidine(34)-2'-O)-methyltransferase [Camelimonas abortus]|uniref:tRNA (cytidine(34)-2'-O)-methyltransferase n=1 Tax=Camelimonas abortus TaxID=1017184 RepID=A0ABV7LEJ5_9HYPH